MNKLLAYLGGGMMVAAVIIASNGGTPETPHLLAIRDSAHSYFVQAVDVSAYLLYQQLMPSGYMRKKSGQNYFKRLDPVVCKVITRQPGGVVRL